MVQKVHFDVLLATCQAKLEDGSRAVVLSFTDNEEGIVHHYPIPVETAEDLDDEIKRLALVS